MQVVIRLRFSSTELWSDMTYPALQAEGERFTPSPDERGLFMMSDRAFGGEGRVAFWTKAGSTTGSDRRMVGDSPAKAYSGVRLIRSTNEPLPCPAAGFPLHARRCSALRLALVNLGWRSSG